MGLEIRITDCTDLGRINEVIHDHWFDLDDVTLNEATSILQIEFLRPPLEAGGATSGWSLLRRVEVPYVASFLRVHRVRSWALKDTQRVGTYDFNELRFDQAKQRIQVTTGIPLELYADVEAFEVSVAVTENVVKTKKRLAFLV